MVSSYLYRCSMLVEYLVLILVTILFFFVVSEIGLNLSSEFHFAAVLKIYVVVGCPGMLKFCKAIWLFRSDVPNSDKMYLNVLKYQVINFSKGLATFIFSKQPHKEFFTFT